MVEAAGLAGIINMPGETTDAWAAFSAMDIFVLTSRVEGLPNVMIEAQLMGIPVVCTGTGGMYETFIEGETGFGVSEGTPATLAAAVSRLASDAGLRSRMSEKALCFARDAFDIERMLDRTIDAYDSTVRTIRPDWQEECPPATLRLGGIVRDRSHQFAADLPPDVDLSGRSLWEDDHPLEPSADASTITVGRYRIAGRRVYFLSSDGSDPRFNGKTYSLRPRRVEFDEIAIEPDVIQAETGHCYVATPGLGDGSAHFRLWEDGKRLGTASCVHEEIRQQGQGRYSVWDENLYFSTSDNTDPRANGRRYLLRREKIVDAANIEPVGPNVSVEEALRRLVPCIAPRRDFVAGRIVHVAGSLGPGGAERQLVYTMSGLINAPVESAQVLCYYLGATGTDRFDFYLPALKKAGVPVRLVRRHFGKRDPSTIPGSLRILGSALPQDLVDDIVDLYWEFIDLRPEIVHAWLDGNLERAGVAAALAGVPRIVLAGRNMNPTQFSYYRPHMDPAYRALLELPQGTMINNSIAGRDDYADWLGVDRNRIQVIYNGIEFPAYPRPDAVRRAALKERCSLDPSSFVVGGIFRFSEEKRPHLWIETAAELTRRLPNAMFILFGDGRLRDEIRQAVERYGLRERVILAGVTTQVLDALAMMDALLLTSAYEGIPNVVLEAQWVGTPVVATRAGGTPEAIDDGATGWIVDPPSAGALADCLVALHENPAARLMAQRRGPDFVRQKFGVPRMVEETLRLYGITPARQEITAARSLASQDVA
jgi:glycosyltransferase involved in cell wall biosynthesis